MRLFFMYAATAPLTAPTPAPMAVPVTTVATLTTAAPPITGNHAGAVVMTATPLSTVAAPPRGRPDERL